MRWPQCHDVHVIWDRGTEVGYLIVFPFWGGVGVTTGNAERNWICREGASDHMGRRTDRAKRPVYNLYRPRG
jgi:hypothetical protein